VADLARTELRCARCAALTDHELAYAGRLLVTSRCTRCGEMFARDVRRRYVADLGGRMRSKPRRIVHRLRRHPVAFAATLPHAVIAKPLRVLDEVRLVLGAAARARRRG
jgi:PHP family Zn ribbon phosphoesterase